MKQYRVEEVPAGTGSTLSDCREYTEWDVMQGKKRIASLDDPEEAENIVARLNVAHAMHTALRGYIEGDMCTLKHLERLLARAKRLEV